MATRKASKPLFFAAIALAISAASAVGIYYFFFMPQGNSATFGLSVVYTDPAGNTVSEVTNAPQSPLSVLANPFAVLWGSGPQGGATMQPGYSFVVQPFVKISVTTAPNNVGYNAIDPSADYTVKLIYVSSSVTDSGPAVPVLVKASGYLAEKSFTVKGSALNSTLLYGIGHQYVPCSFYLNEASAGSLVEGKMYATKVTYTMKVELWSSAGRLATATGTQSATISYQNTPNAQQVAPAVLSISSITLSPTYTTSP